VGRLGTLLCSIFVTGDHIFPDSIPPTFGDFVCMPRSQPPRSLHRETIAVVNFFSLVEVGLLLKMRCKSYVCVVYIEMNPNMHGGLQQMHMAGKPACNACCNNSIKEARRRPNTSY